MENEDLTKKSEACLSLKKRLLTSLWEDVSPLLTEVLKLSRHPTEEDAILELSRSEMLFVALLQALRTKNTVMSGRLLLEVDGWHVLSRLSFYLGHKLHVEFNCPGDFFSNAAEFAHSLQNSGLFNVPAKLLGFLDHLSECMMKEIEARSSELQACGSQQEIDTGKLNDQCGTPKRAKKKTNKNKGNSASRDSRKVTDNPSLQDSTQLKDSTQQQVADYASPLVSTHSNSFTQHQVPDESCSKISSRGNVFTQQQVTDGFVSQVPIIWKNLNQQQGTMAGNLNSSLNSSPSSTSIPHEVHRSKAAVKKASKDLKTALEREDLEAVLTAIQAGADIERRDELGWTPLHWASFFKGDVLVGALIQAGADVEARVKRGYRPLHMAARSGNHKTVARLVEAGADASAKDSDGRTPLHWAAGLGRVQVVEVLLKAGADREAVDNERNRPLHHAARNGMDTVVVQLVQAGADLNVVSGEGRTPLQWAEFWNCQSTASLLRTLGVAQSPMRCWEYEE